MTAAEPSLRRAAHRLIGRLAALDARLEAEDPEVWGPFLQATEVLALLVLVLHPERTGRLLTTGEMAARLGVRPKTLLKHKAHGAIRPAVQHGKFIRWRGDERPRHGPADA